MENTVEQGSRYGQQLLAGKLLARELRAGDLKMGEAEWRRALSRIGDRDILKALDCDLLTATRYRSLTILQAGAAHDLRGPLNSMVVNLELLKQSMNAPGRTAGNDSESGRRDHYINVIQQEIYRLNRYVQALLELTAPSDGGCLEADVVQLVTEITGLIRAQAKLQRVHLDWYLPDHPVIVPCQKIALRQVLLNLIINALEAMPEGGDLLITLREDAAMAVVDIHDTGVGVPEAQHQRIFEMYFSTKETGTGIGLYVSKSIINEMNGDITFISKAGEGSCFTVHIPKLSIPASLQSS